MQPYFFPFIGYFQLMRAADIFVFYDDVQYKKGGWVNRNRILIGGAPAWITFPVVKDSYEFAINRRLYDLNSKAAARVQRQILEAYRKAPAFKRIFPFLEAILGYGEPNVAVFNRIALEEISSLIGIKCQFKVSSQLKKNEELRGQDRVIEICRALGATTYINPAGGLDLYNQNDFESCGIDLMFLRSQVTEYNQFGESCIPFLSIIDVLMFNTGKPLESILCDGYDLFQKPLMPGSQTSDVMNE
jgi:WbqC-like protein family